MSERTYIVIKDLPLDWFASANKRINRLHPVGSIVVLDAENKCVVHKNNGNLCYWTDEEANECLKELD